MRFVPFAAAFAVAALLAGCASPRTSAPVVDRSPVPAPAPKPPVAQVAPVPGAAPASAASGTYVVKRGDTLYSIALDHGADHRDLAQWNKLDNPNRIQAGQMLRVTPPESDQASGVQIGAARGSGPVESRPIESRPLDSKPAATPPATASGTRTEPKAVRLPYSPENVALLQKNDPGAAPPAAKAEPAPVAPKPAAEPAPKPVPAPAPAAEAKEADAVEFIWPARGKLLAGFNEPTSKGLDIAGKPGDPVVAAAAGRVIYIGTGIRGYGKLIVIKHDNNFNSVYGHNREILVKQDQQVTRGQKIAELGDSDADTPRLHFEIRKSGKPVDPARYLPPP